MSEVLPVAVALLSDDVLAGDRYDGELIVALAGLDAEYWKENKGAASLTVCALDEVKDRSQDAELLKDVSTLMSTLGSCNEL